jgi:hypothetical protein
MITLGALGTVWADDAQAPTDCHGTVAMRIGRIVRHRGLALTRPAPAARRRGKIRLMRSRGRWRAKRLRAVGEQLSLSAMCSCEIAGVMMACIARYDRSNWVFGVLLAVLAACATGPATASEASQEARVRAEIMPLFTAMQAAANVHDAEAHLAFFVHDPQLTFVANGSEIRGWDNLLAQQKKWWPDGKIAPTDEAHQPYRLAQGPAFQLFGPRLAMLTFVIDARRVYPDHVMRRPIAVSQLWEKTADRWMIVYAHESLGPERPGN